MAINYLELTEAEEDFTGVNRANLVVNEEHTFTDPNERIFAPDLGQFYLNENFMLVDQISGRELVKGTDYDVDYFSKRVFAKSGIDNAYLIHVKNPAIDGVLLTCQVVGGLYTSPGYLIQMMLEKYPDGIGPVIYWKNVLFKPDQFVPAGHRHHALEVFGLSPFNDSLERVRGAMTDTDRVKFQAFYDNTLGRFEELLNSINNGYNGLMATFQETRKGLELQQGDFIYTDSNADQAVLRRYGKWRRHINTMLAAGGPDNAGTSMSVGKGYSNPIRNTNLFQRIDDPWDINGEITEQTLLLQPSKVSFNEGETISIDFLGVNIPPGTMITGQFVGIAADNIKGGQLAWQITLDAFGKATLLLETVNNGRTTGNIDITIMPDQFATSAITVTMIDTSRTPVYDLFFSSDAQGLNRITRVNEGSVMYMNLVVTNPILNEEVTVNYTAGSATQADFITPLPSTITIPSNGITRVRLETLNDERAEGQEVFVAAILPKGSIDLGLAKARAEIVIVDTSYQAEFNAVFSNDTGGQDRISETNEGQTFYLYATTSLPNGTVVNLEYGGTMRPDDFTERPTSATVSAGVVVAAITTRADARTDGDKIMGLSVKRTNGIVLVNLSIIVRDTSQAPEATIYFTDTNGGSNSVDTFNEGQTIFITINTRNVENGSYLDLSYQMDGAINQADINKEFTAPLPTRVPITNNRAIIAATILEDYKTDQNRNFRCTLDMSGVYASCIIRDTSVPIVAAKFSSSSTGAGNIVEANEGQTVYLVVESKGYAAGTTLNLSYAGLMSDDDFSQPRPTAITVNATGTNIVPMTIKNDFTSEGVEDMQVTVRSGQSTVANTSLTVRDTSLTPVLNVLLSLSETAQTAISSINEGVTAFVHLNWTNLPINSTINWKVTNITTNDADFDKKNGTVVNTVYTGTGYDSLTTKLDRTTEGNETFRITASVLLGDGRTMTVETGTITLVDTSLTEEFTVGFSSDPAGNTMITRVNEGSAVYLVMRGTNIANGSTFNLSLPSVGPGFANNADLTPPVTGLTLTMNNNFVSQRFDITADRLTEGDETLIVRATRASTNVPRDASLIVVDTSTTVGVTAGLYLANGTKPISNLFKEGESGYLLVDYVNGTIGDRIRPVLPTGAGNAIDADFTSSEFGNEKIITTATGSIRWNFAIKADRTTEGDKNFAVSVNNLTSATNYPLDGTYKIVDTSKTTTYTQSGWYNNAANPIVSSPEGSDVFLQTLPVDGVIGDVYRLSITGGTAGLNTDYSVNAANIVYNTDGMKIQWGFRLIADRITDGDKTIIASIINTTTGQTVGNWTLTITDTSRLPTAALGYFTTATGGSAITQANEGSVVHFRFIPVNGVVGDKWRVSIAANSEANAADIGNFQPVTVSDTGQSRDDFRTQFTITADELTEGNETLILQVEFQANGSTTWENKGTSNLLINDTSKTAAFDIYYSTNQEGTDRLPSIGEGRTVYLIVKTTNVAAGTVLQVSFTGSTVDKDDFTTAPPFEFPADINTLIPMTVQANGIAYYRFDIKADFSVG